MARCTHDAIKADARALDWGIVGRRLMPGARRPIEGLSAQDGLYTLIERDGTGKRASVIGAISDAISAGESPAALLDAQATRIVSLTVTENGYCLDPSTKRLDPEHRLIRADLENPQAPKSAVGVIVEAYRRRFEAGRSPVTALSCDNIQHNGSLLHGAVLALADLRDKALAAGIEDNARFPGTMVDRITRVPNADDVAGVAERYALDDRAPVICEPFRPWVIEDDFCAGRPAWERVGAQFTSDIAPYEFMKLRLLNGSHLAVAGLGRLASVQFALSKLIHIINYAQSRLFGKQLLCDRSFVTLVPAKPTATFA